MLLKILGVQIKRQFFREIGCLGLRASFLPVSCGRELRSAKNETTASPSEKQNAVLTLARGANYKSCRTQNSPRTEFDVVAVDYGRFVVVREQI
jgi:hypothetical protein